MAYKQNFGKTASTGHGQIFQDKGLVSPMHKDKKKKKDTNTGSDQVNVETYNVETKTGSERTVKKNSPSHEVAKEFGAEIDFGKSVSQEAPTGPSKETNGTNRNPWATRGNSGNIKAGYKGMATSVKTGKRISFENNNNDKLKNSGEWRLH